MKPRPKCPTCGKGVGRRATQQIEVVIPEGQKPVFMLSNSHPHVTKEWSYGCGVNEQSVRVVKHIREIWDGESFYLPKSRPWCSTPCALKFARAAYNNGWRGEVK